MSRGYRWRHLSSHVLGKNRLLRLAIILMYLTTIGVALFYGYRHNWYGFFHVEPSSEPVVSSLPLRVPARPDPHLSTPPLDLEKVLSDEEEEGIPKDPTDESELATIFRQQEEGQAYKKTGAPVQASRRAVSPDRKKAQARKKPFRLTGHQV